MTPLVATPAVHMGLVKWRNATVETVVKVVEMSTAVAEPTVAAVVSVAPATVVTTTAEPTAASMAHHAVVVTTMVHGVVQHGHYNEEKSREDERRCF